eukprot:1184242-Amphidinium_carterae.1
MARYLTQNNAAYFHLAFSMDLAAAETLMALNSHTNCHFLTEASSPKPIHSNAKEKKERKYHPTVSNCRPVKIMFE